MNRIYFLLVMAVFHITFLQLVPLTGFSQSRIISGKVSDTKDKSALPGVTVQVKGTETATQTNQSGDFSIEIARAARTLSFSSVGFETQDVSIGSSNVINVSLASINDTLQDVVVVGYGTQKKGEVTSATASVPPEDFRQGGARNPLDLIQGKVAGLTITRTSNNPNSGAAIILRGATSLSGSNSPLIVIDGIPGGNLDLLQQDDIASIDVLKDGSAAAIYGTRANGGVILVTTKKGKEGPARFDYANYFRKEFLSSRPDFLDAAEYRAKITEGVIGTTYDLGSSDDMYDALLNHGNLTQYHNFALSGGSNNTNYRVSMFYQDLQGIAKQSARTNYGGRLSIFQKGFNDRLSAQVNVATNFNKANLLGDGISWETALTRNPTAPIYKPDGTFAEDATTANPLARLFQETNWRTQQTSSLDAKITLDIYNGLTASVFGSLQRNTWVDDRYRTLASRSSILDLGGGGYAYKGSELENNYAFEPTLNYNRTIADKHVVAALAGYSYQYNVTSTFNASNVGFINDIFRENNLGAGTGLNANATFRAGMGSEKQDNKLIAFFGRANYAYNGKYLATFIIRREGSSRFGVNNKWGNFPAASVGWNISKENFMNNVNFVNNLKFRVGYGITGNQGFANYSSLTTLSTGNTYLYPDGVWRQTYGPDRNPNPDLRWEKKKELNVGIDFGLLGNRLTGAIDVYRRNTVDLLGTFDTQLPGFVRDFVLANVGTIANNGVELTLSAVVIRKGAFTWDMDIAASHATSKLTKFNAIGFRGNPQTFGDIPGAGALGRAVRVAEGSVLGNFYGKRFAGFASNGSWLFYKRDGKTQVPFNQINTSNDQTITDLAVIGNGIPKYYASWTNTFRYKNFDLRVFLRGKFGFDILNINELGYGTRAVLPGNVLQSTFGKNDQLRDTYQYSDYYIEKGDYVKVDEITLGYNVKLNSSYIRNLRVYATGQNLATITNYTGNDPDFISDVFSNNQSQAPGMDSRGPYPRTRSFLIGLMIGF